MTVTIKIDDKAVSARFARTGIPEAVRNNLRRALPDLTKRLGDRVEQKLNTELKSRKRLKVNKQLRENPREVLGVVETVWTGDRSKNFIPTILETGARRHMIYPKNASALFFFWERIGQNVALAKVNHPGFPGIYYTERSYLEMEPEILQKLSRAVITGVAA